MKAKGKYLIDSDYIADYLKGYKQAVTLLEKLFSDGMAMSVVSFAEVYEGIHYGNRPYHYRQVFYRQVFGIFTSFVPVLPLTKPIAHKLALMRGELRARNQLIPHPDLFIAATAIQHKLTLVTRNLKDFEKIKDFETIPDLEIY